MRAVLFTCLLVVAGISAMPQDIVPAQDRIVDLWLKNAIHELSQFLINNGLDPLALDYYIFADTIIQDMVYLEGFLEEFLMIGASGIRLKEVTYHILIGQLFADVVLDKVVITVGRYVAKGRLGDRGGRGELSGSLEIADLRVVVNTLLNVIPGWPVTIHNINTSVTLGHIKSDFKASFECLGCLEPRDVSCCVNSFFNKRIPDAMVTYKHYIDVAVAEFIRNLVNQPRI